MIKVRTASVLVGAVAAVAIGGAAFAAGGNDPSPGPSASGGIVDMLPNGDVVPSAGDTPSPDDSAAPSASPPSAGLSSSISVDAAKAIAIRVAGGGYVESIEPETEHGRAVWDVSVIVKGVEHDVDVDRATGEVTRHQIKGTSSEDSTTQEAGDDNGGQGRGDDDANDDNGSGGHGSDDQSDDDSGGRGSDD
jgi:hypothetical protein